MSSSLPLGFILDNARLIDIAVESRVVMQRGIEAVITEGKLVQVKKKKLIKDR